MGAMKNLAIVAAEEGFRKVPAMEYAVVVNGAVMDVYADPADERGDAQLYAWDAQDDVDGVEVVPFIQFEPEVFLGEDDAATSIS